MNKVIKKSFIATLLSVFVFGLVVLSGHGIPSISVAYAQSASCGLTGATVANSIIPLIPSAGGTITYTLDGTTANISTSTAVTINDVLDSQRLTFVSSSANIAGASYSSSRGVWDLGTLNNGTYIHLQITATVNAGTEGQVIDNAPTINYVPSDNSCAQSDAINDVSVTVYGTPSASLTITKNANPTTVVAGSTTTVDYTITVMNNSTSTTSDGVVVNDPLPAGLIFESSTAPSAYNATSGVWTVNNLSAGSTASLSIYAEAAQDASSTIWNTATVTASTTNSNSSNDTAKAMITVTQPTSTPSSTPSASLSISKSVYPTSVTEGATTTVEYTLTVANASTSATTSQNVAVSDSWPSSGLTFVSSSAPSAYNATSGVWTVGPLAPGASSTLMITAYVDADATSSITNTATVTASTTNPNSANDSAQATITLTGGSVPTSTTQYAELSIDKIANPTSTQVGDTVNYTITVTNNGPATATNVVASDTLPSELTFEIATASASTSYASSTGLWTINTLAPSSTATLTIAAEVNTSTLPVVTNIATVSQASSTTDPLNATPSSSVSVAVQQPTSTTPSAFLTISKAVNPTSVAPGATTTVEYTLTVANASTSATTSQNVAVSDSWPSSGLTFVSSSAPSAYNATSGVWTVGPLAPGASSTLYITADVDADATSSITNTATVTASTTNPNSANDSAQATITMQSSGCGSNCGGGGGGGGGSVFTDMSITKTVDNASPATGATIHYTLTAKDGGQNPTFAVVADDILPAGLTFVSATSSEGSYASSTGVWTIGALNAGQAVTLTITAMVTAPGGTAITNTATVSQTPTIMDPVASNNTASVTINVAGGGGQVLGASTSTGQVLGASCGLYLTSYIHPYRQKLNDPAQVKKLQAFLNMNLGLNLPVTGYYGKLTIAAVDQFQEKYHNEVLTPWVPLGLPTPFTPTNYVYQSTQRWINFIMCPALNLPLPALKVDNGE